MAFNWTFMDLIRRRIFGAPRGRDGELRAEQPLRSELLSVDQLRQHARTIASSHEIDRRFGPDQLLPRLAENESCTPWCLRSGLGRGEEQGVRIAPAADWLLDNFHLIEEQIRTARRHLPRTYSGELPRLASGPLAGYPRVYAIALELISHGDGRRGRREPQRLRRLLPDNDDPEARRIVGHSDHAAPGPTRKTCAALPSGSPRAGGIAKLRTSGRTACWRSPRRHRGHWCSPWQT